ncbi:hypothetical protein DD238_002572 [Peronospora effusa]|uniref:Rotatin N-terminal domain-containing protein n=1 Tax=Peronospora effusa TaxID=542832 RepID=A0A3M6VI90_9STRA|nr:hypothetical protein DD238_002572 [Peronospora effusa]
MNNDVTMRLDALVLKLRHPLIKIRSRALHSLLFKLRENLVQWQDLEPLQTSLIPSLLACLEPPLELETLHVLQLLVQSQSDILVTSLQHYGAAEKLQRGANKNPELQATYEKLLKQIYVTKLVSVEEKQRVQVNQLEKKEKKNPVAEEKVRAHRVSCERQRAHKVDELEAQGWRFAQVTLTSVDEQHLFEFEVKLQLKTEIQDIVTACATFRNELLRNFPAEVFLQRPVVLQHLLHLVQQPIFLPDNQTVSSERGEDADTVVEKAMEVSMGVNYFDEMLNSTFSSKRGNLTGAVVMASLKAIESFLYALQLARKPCLDPTYVVYAPHVHVKLFDSYDSRRVLYPRARVEIGVDVSRQWDGESGAQFEQYSLSGAVYRIFISVLPLLRSARHPRLHFLNLLIAALPDLPEKSHLGLAESNGQKLNKLRLERIFGILSGICRPVPPEQAGSNIMDDELELTYSMTWKLVELVLKLLRLYPSSQYCVEKHASKADCDKSSGKTDGSGTITIPRLLWDALKLWIASPVFSEVSSKEWKDESVIQFLAEVDSTIPAFINLKQSSLQDAKSIFHFVEFSKLHHEHLANFDPWKKPSTVTLEVARKTIQARCVFNSTDTEIIADAVLQTIWSVLTEGAKDKSGKIVESDVGTIHLILYDMLSELGEMEKPALHDPMVVRFFRGFVDLVEELNNGVDRVSAGCRHQFMTEVICEPKFVALLLLALARHDGDSGDKTNSAVFWKILRITSSQLANFPNDKLVLLLPVVPLLQHFAYIEPSEGSCQEQRSTQPQLAEVLNRLETIVSDHSRKVLVCRCLLHQLPCIRKAASSRVIRLLAQTTPSYVEKISKDESVREDPFGGTTVCDGKNLNFEAALMETPLPAVHVGCRQPSENELSSQLSKLDHLCKVISGTCLAFESMREAALKELVMFIEHTSVELFTLLEEMDKLSGLIDLLRSFLQTEENRHDSSMVQQTLIVLRTLLLRSWLLRSAIQRDNDMMELLMASVYHSSVSVRAQMYYILLLLTCSAENFIPSGKPAELLSYDKMILSGEAKIPEMIKTTFGLYSGRWMRCLIVTYSLKQQLQASCALLTKRTDSLWLQEVRAIISETPYRSDVGDVKNDADSNTFSILLGAEYAIVAQKLRDAPSHGKCLNALYHLMTMCEAWHFGREHFVGEWEADFERYFAVPPKSERDETIIGSLVVTLSVMFSVMTRREQLRALVVVKRKVLPLLKKSQSKTLSLQVARLLLNVSESKVRDLFLSLAADTDIIATICTKYSAIYATESVLHGLMLEVLLRFAKAMDEDVDSYLSAPSRDKICKRLLEMLSPLLTVVCRHRVPGSFLERDVFAVGSQCMITILRLLPPDSLLASDCPLEHTDSSNLLDGSWASRFLFDHVSSIRELGFLIIEHASSSKPPPNRLLQMVFETCADDTESDAVRAAACTALTKEILQYHERSSDKQAVMLEIFHGTAFSGKMLRLLLHALKGNKLYARASSAFARLVRVLYVQRDRVAPIFGDMQKELDAAGQEFEVYRLFVQALSLREWKNNCDRYCSSYMLLPSCDRSTWRRSLLPAILDLMSEVLNLFQAICRDAGFDQAAFFLMHTTLQFQLMVLVQDIHASFDNTLTVATKRRHYGVLDLCAGTLSILVVQAFDQHSKYVSMQLGASTTPGFEGDFVGVVAKLLGPHHPIDFRVSFSRIVPSISLLIPGLLKSLNPSIANALASVTFDLYREVAEFRHLDANTIVAAVPELQDRTFPLACIRRVSCALRVLLESSINLQPLVWVKRALPFAMASIKESFSAIRIAGGFGGKRDGSSNTSSNTQCAYVLDLCGRIQTHIEVMSAIVGSNRERQQLVKGEGLLSVLLSNWSVMNMARVRGSQLMLRALHLLANYTFENDTARGSMLISLQSGSAKNAGSERSQTLLSRVLDLAISRGEMTSSHGQVARGAIAASAADMAVSNAACQVAKAALLNTECVLASLKTGSISRLINSLQDRLKQHRQTSKTNHLETGNLAHMLGVLSNVASNKEGARLLYTNWANVLSLVLDDVMHSSDEAIRRNGCLVLRNLALSRAAKNHFAMWEALLDDMIALCVRVSSTPHVDLISLDYLSAALWSLVYDNQKARALLLSRPTSLRNLQQVLGSQNTALQQTFTKDSIENLRRLLMLVKE